MENKNKDSYKYEYAFSNFYLTAFLTCEHAHLVKIVMVDKNKKKCEFILRSNVELEPIARDYFNGKIKIDPQKHKEKIVALKSALHEVLEKNGDNKNGK